MGNLNSATEDLLDILRPHYGVGVTLSAVAGGDCHKSYRVDCEDGRQFFMKTNTARYTDVLASEHFSLCKLAELLDEEAGMYPAVEAYRQEAGISCLMLEWRELGTLNESNGEAVANSLVRQHSLQAEKFGWEQPNFIGLTRQDNNWNGSWADFFLSERLLPQAEQAKNKGMPVSLVEQVKRTCDHAYALLQPHQPTPSLLHGDLWTGNLSWDTTRDELCLYDPAPYFGDVEVDIAMSRLFGQLPTSFYRRYGEVSDQSINKVVNKVSSNDVAKSDTNTVLSSARIERDLVSVQQRAQVYNFFHALNHFNLFGEGYLNMVESHLFM